MEYITQNLEVSNEIEILIFKKDGEMLLLKSFVYDVVSPTEIVISNPIYENKLFPLHRGNVHNFRFYKENMGMFLFKGTIGDRIKFDNLPAMKITQSTDCKKIQRRRFFRLDCLINGTLTKEEVVEVDMKKVNSRLANNPNVIVETEEVVEVQETIEIVDISGGGLKAISRTSHENDEIVNGKFVLNGLEITFEGTIVRNIPQSDGSFDIGIKFTGMSSSIQNQIIRYIFQKQRVMREKGLI